MGNTTVRPDALASVGGALGQRFHANIDGRIKDVGLSEQYIRWHELKDWDDWFWVGEHLGKWLDGAVYSALATGDAEMLRRVDELIERLARTQEPDGYVGIVRNHRRTPVRGMQLYEWYYLLLGLITCADLLQNQTALQIAQRLAGFITRTWGDAPGQFPLAGMFPGNGHEGGEGTLILEPLALLAEMTGDAGLVAWCEAVVAAWDRWFEAYPMSLHTCGYTQMKRFAAGEIALYELRDNMHAHTFHMTLLGLAALHKATGKDEYRQTVLGCVNRIIDRWVFITGAMSTGERYVGHQYYHPNGEVEVCPQHTWILLLEQAYRWTGEARYLDEIERDTFNHLLAAQLADGTNWSYMTPLNGHAQRPESSNCCNASGLRILSRIPTYIYGLRDDAPAVLMYTESQAVVSAPGLLPVTLRQATAYPSDGCVELHVDPESAAQFPLHLRVPAFAAGGTVSVNGEPVSVDFKPGFITLNRLWQPGDVVQLSFNFPVTCHANGDYAAVVRGPLVYAHFETGQPGYAEYFWHHPGYAADRDLLIDPENPGAAVTEVPVAESLVGPGLRVPSRRMPRAPMFTSAEANAQLPAEADEAILLLPFMNQGSLGGNYEVFKRYRVPS